MLSKGCSWVLAGTLTQDERYEFTMRNTRWSLCVLNPEHDISKDNKNGFTNVHK